MGRSIAPSTLPARAIKLCMWRTTAWGPGRCWLRGVLVACLGDRRRPENVLVHALGCWACWVGMGWAGNGEVADGCAALLGLAPGLGDASYLLSRRERAAGTLVLMAPPWGKPVLLGADYVCCYPGGNRLGGLGSLLAAEGGGRAAGWLPRGSSCVGVVGAVAELLGAAAGFFVVGR